MEKNIVNVIKEIHGLGMFLAHEYYIDFTYIGKYIDEWLFPFTENEWTAVLPGSSKGLRYIFPSLKGLKTQEIGIHVLQEISHGYLSDLGGFNYLKWNGKEYSVSPKGLLSLHQIEFNLCEYQKLKKILQGTGRLEVFKQKTDSL